MRPYKPGASEPAIWIPAFHWPSLASCWQRAGTQGRRSRRGADLRSAPLSGGAGTVRHASHANVDSQLTLGGDHADPDVDQWPVDQRTSGETLDVLDPATEELIERVPAGERRRYDAAVDAASAAFSSWRRYRRRANRATARGGAQADRENRGAGNTPDPRRRQAARRKPRRDGLVGGVFPLLCRDRAQPAGESFPRLRAPS